MGPIENKGDRLEQSHLKNHIEYKLSQCLHQQAGAALLDKKQDPNHAVYQKSHFRYKDRNR